MSRSKCTAEEQSRLRLRYDLLSIDVPELLEGRPTVPAKDPENGITKRLDKAFNDIRVPGGTISVRTRAIWRQCVRSRLQLSADRLAAIRAADIACVRKWMQTWLQTAGAKTGDDQARITEFYGLDRKFIYSSAPMGSESLDIRAAQEETSDPGPAVNIESEDAEAGVKREQSPFASEWLDRIVPPVIEHSKNGVKKEEESDSVDPDEANARAQTPDGGIDAEGSSRFRRKRTREGPDTSGNMVSQCERCERLKAECIRFSDRRCEKCKRDHRGCLSQVAKPAVPIVVGSSEEADAATAGPSRPVRAARMKPPKVAVIISKVKASAKGRGVVRGSAVAQAGKPALSYMPPAIRAEIAVIHSRLESARALLRVLTREVQDLEQQECEVLARMDEDTYRTLHIES